MVYGEVGNKDAKVYIKERMIAYWCRMISGKQHKLSNIMYRLLKSKSSDLNDNYESKWIKMVKDTLNFCGMSNIWDNELDGYSSNYVKKALKLRLADNFTQDWNNSVHGHDQCVNYRMFKENFIFEKYLTSLDYKDRITFCKFRCRNHFLPITHNRFDLRNGIHQDTKCSLCTSDDIGDEFHYVFKCSFFENDRLLYIGRKYSGQQMYIALKNCLTVPKRAN